MPIFDLIEKVMVKRFKFPLGVALRLVVRSTYVGEIFKTIYVFFLGNLDFYAFLLVSLSFS